MKKMLKKALAFVLSAAFALQLPAVSGAAAADVVTNLKNLTALGGNMSTSADGITLSGQGDCFAISDSEADEFVYSSDVTFNENKGAASLIFLSTNTPGSSSYCANIDKNMKNARVFSFPGGNTVGEYKLTSAQAAKSTFNIKVQLADNYITMFIDNVPVISTENKKAASMPGRKLGILTYDSSITYKNTVYSPMTAALSGLTVENAQLSAEFDPDTFAYTAHSAYSQQSVSFSSSGIDSAYVISETGAAKKLAAAAGKYTAVTEVGDNKLVLICGQSSYIVNVKRAVDPDGLYGEDHRSQLHFSPQKNWMNDPNGLVFDPSNNTYHLFYQWNPYGLNIANQVWGHAESTDLMNWKQIDSIAIDQDDTLGAIFSGSCVVDEDNTSGFFTDNKAGESKLVALYTSDGGDNTHGVEKQSIAYSKDHGHTWIKPSVEKEGFENPIIKNDGEKYGRDFRDPKVFRHDGKWMMVIAGGRARVFTSDNLINWSEAGDLGFNSECPDLYPLPVDSDKNNMKWVYTASGDWYTIGELTQNGEKNGVTQYKYTALTERLPYNGAPEVYATQSYYNDGSNKNRRISISWLQDNSAGQLNDKGWNGYDTLPHEMGIKTVNGKMRLTSYPVEELNAYRTKTLYTAENKKVGASDGNILANIAGDKYDVEATFTPGNASVFGFRLRCGKGQYTEVKYSGGKLILDRSNSGKVMGGVLSCDLAPEKDGKIKMRIVVDKATIEAFGNSGEAAISALVFPDAESLGMEFFTDSDVTIDSMRIYYLKSALKENDIAPKKGLYLTSSESKISVGESVNISACNFTGTDDKISWTVSDSSVASLTENKDGTVVLKGLKNGSAKIEAAAGEFKDSLTINVIERKFTTNMTGWTPVSGRWETVENGYRTYGVANSDAFAFSSVSLDNFTYEADIIADSELFCAGLVFGKSGSTWYGANITIKSANVDTKLFMNTGSEVWKVEGSVLKAKVYHLKLTADDKSIKYYVNDKLVATKAIDKAILGQLGFVSYNGAATFDNANAYDNTVVPDPDPGDTPDPGDKPDPTPKPDIKPGDGVVVVNGKTELYKDNKRVTGTKLETVKGKTYYVKNSYVATGKKQVISIGKATYIIDKNGVVIKSAKAKYKTESAGGKTYVIGKTGKAIKATGKTKLAAVGKKTYIVNKKGQVIKAKKGYIAVKVGKKKYIVGKTGAAIKNKKRIKAGKAYYKTDKKGVAKKI